VPFKQARVKLNKHGKVKKIYDMSSSGYMHYEPSAG
jgi:hypothetical protein